MKLRIIKNVDLITQPFPINRIYIYIYEKKRKNYNIFFPHPLHPHNTNNQCLGTRRIIYVNRDIWIAYRRYILRCLCKSCGSCLTFRNASNSVLYVHTGMWS